ncbi:MAG TPA: hypothetical protein QGH10_15025 [Armatimonadota bacterium]|nr:hypothetical protein [Armatimonadota bacterium]
MTDTPKLPASPMSTGLPDPRHEVWRARALRLGYTLVAVSGLGTPVLATLWPGILGSSVPVSGMTQLAFQDVYWLASLPGAILLLALLALQIASRSGRVGRVAAIAARPAGALLAVAYGHILTDYWDTGSLTIGFAACGVVASVLLIAIPVRRRSPSIRGATTAAAITSAGALGLQCAQFLPLWWPHLWMTTGAVVAGLLPVLGCIALLWLIYTEPGGEA